MKTMEEQIKDAVPFVARFFILEYAEEYSFDDEEVPHLA